MSESISDDALRAQVRMQVAFWKAKDRRSISTGPAWLWRGTFAGPRRITDLSAPTAEKITRRRAAGLPAEHLYSAAGPRRYRLPRSVSPGRAAAWITAAAMAAAWWGHSHLEQPRMGAVFAALAAAAAVIGAGIAALDFWARRDPLRLNDAEHREIAAQRREVAWNPLAGSGELSAGGAYMLEAIDTCAQLRDHPAWQLPAAQPLRWQIDLDEEMFQIARAGAALDLYENVLGRGGADEASRRCRRQLADALLERLVALHRCLHTLSELSRAAVADPADDADASRAVLVAAVENELATGEWNELTADLLAHTDAYAVLAEVKTAPR